jgi:hypothetical protein
MSERDYWTARLALALREVHHRRYMSLEVVVSPWWAFWKPSWWLEDSNGHRYRKWPW